MKHEFSAKIFEPSSSINWIPNSTVLVWGGFIIAFTSIFISNLIYLESELLWLTILGLSITFTGGIWGAFEKEQPHGKIKGNLTITEESITVNENIYKWDSVRNFSFHLLYYKNEHLHYSGYRFHGGPAYSAGVDSYVEFSHDSDEELVYFRLNSSNHKEMIKQAIIGLYLCGKINLKTTYNGLYLSYEEIQELKKRKIEFKEKSS